MPKKRKCRLKALPERQCKKPRISISLRENRKSINYNETIEISSEDSKGKHEDEQIDDVENSSNSSVVILDNVKQGENGKPSFFESINISFHDERFPEGNTDGEELQKPEEFTASVINQETPVENGEITQNKVDIEDLNIPAEKGCGSTISLSSCDSKSTTSKRKKRNSKKQPTITEEIFYVEKILEMKYENGKRLFFLKWEGFPDSENSWEPEENIQSNTMVEEFLESLRNSEKNKTNEMELEANKLNKHDDNEVKNMEEISDKNCNDVISNENVIKCHEETGNGSSDIKEEILNSSNPSSVIVISNENSNSISDQKSINTDHNEGQSDKNDNISTKIVVEVKEESKVSTDSSIKINNVTEESESKEFPTNLNNLISNAEKLATLTVDYDESAPIVTQENQLLETTQLEDVSVNPEIHRSTSSLSLSFRKKKKSKKKNRRKGKNKFINEEIIKEKIDEEKIVPVEPDEIFPLVSLRTRRNMKSLKEILDCSDHSDISEHENLELDKAVNHESDSSELSIKSAKKTDSKSSIDHNAFFPSNLPQNVQEIFMVEKILKMKIINGVRKFFLKWEGFPDSENTWEPEENLECPELIKEFLKEQRKLKCAKKRKRLLSADSLNLEELPEEVIIKEPAVKPRGFPRSREPESILAAGMMNDQMMFLIKWKNVDMANLVSARRANIECPQVVIRFYENHLNWENTSHLNLTSVPKENLANPIEDEFTKINKTISKKLNADPASTMNTLISLLDNDDENIPVRKPTNFLKIKPKPVNRKTTLPYRGRPLTKLFERKTNTETLPKTSVIGSSSNSMMDLINNFKGPRALLPHKLPVTNTVSRPLPPPTPLENLSRVYESRDIPKEQTPPPPKFELPKPNQTQLLRPINSYRPDFNPRRFGISSRPLLNASQHSQINSSQKIQMPSLTPSMTMPTLKAAPTLALIHQPNSLINFQSPSSNYDASSSINNYIDNSPIDQKNISLPNSNNNNNNNNNNNFNRYLQVVDSITNNTPIPQTTLHQLLQHDQKPSFNQIVEPQINNYMQTTEQSIHNNNNINNNNINNNNNPNNFIHNPINQMRSMTASINQQMIPPNRSIQSDFHQNYNNNINNNNNNNNNININNNNRNSTRMQLVSALQTRYQNANPQIITMHPNIIPTTNLSYLSSNQLNSMSSTPQYQYVINTNNNINQQQNNYNQNNIIQQQQQTYYTQQPSMSPSPIINANTRFILPKMDTFSMQGTTDMNQHLILQSSHNNQYQQRINNPQNNPEILQNSYLLEHFCN